MKNKPVYIELFLRPHTWACICFVFFVFLLNSLQAQAPKYQFKHISEREGLPLVNIHSIIKDSRGFMWFSTDGGVVKFDGYNYVTYLANKSDSNTISGSYVLSVIENNDGNMWIATTDGLCMLDVKKDRIKRFYHQPDNPNSLSSDYVSSMAMDKNGNLWVSTYNAGINLFQSESGHFKHFKNVQGNANSLGSDATLRLFFDSRNCLWIGMINGSMDVYDPATNEFQHIELKDYRSNHINRNQIRAITQDSTGTIWAGTSGSGLYSINPNAKPFVVKRFSNQPGVNVLSNNYISSLAIDELGNLLIGTENGGLNYFNIKTNIFYHYTSEKDNLSSLAHHSVWSIYVDNDFNLWVGTFSTGLNLSVSEKPLFKHYFNIPNNAASLSSNTVSCFYEDKAGNIWVGTDGGGLNLFNRKTETFKAYTTTNSNLVSDAILSIYEDKMQNLWVGAWGGGLSIFDREKGTFKNFNSANSGLTCENIISIFEDSNKTLWAGTFWCEGGVNYFNVERKRFSAYTTSNSGLSDNTVYAIMQDSYGMHWFATNIGVTRYNSKTNQFTNFRSSDTDSATLSHNTVMAIIESHDSVLWMATANGLTRFDTRLNKFKRYLISDGLPSNYIAGLEEDLNGNIWLATQDGISCFNPVTQKFTNYKPSQGLQGRQFFRCSHYKLSDGTILFGGSNGFNMFHPDNIDDKIIKPEIFFTSLTVVNQPAKIGEGLHIADHISFTREIMLLHRENSFSIGFAAINYTSPEEVRYAYKLEGFDEDWVYCQNQRQATYTNINPGEYIFRVKVPYNSGIENAEGIFIKVIITPPVYQTWWFRILALVFVVLVVFGFFAYRIREVNKRNRLLSLLVEERTSELLQKNMLLEIQTKELNEANSVLQERQMQIEEQSEELVAQKEELEKFLEKLKELNATKDKFFSIIAHDVKNPFGAVLGFADLLQSKYENWDDVKRKHIIGLLYKSAQNVYRLLENLLQWSRSQRGVIEFNPLNMPIRDEIENIISILQNNAKQKNITLTSIFDNDIIQIYADRQMFNAIIRNLVSNAIKFTPEGGNVTVKTSKENDSVIISVSDNGVGMTDDMMGRLFRIDSNFSTSGTNQETGTGLGLILVKEFVSRHNGNITVASIKGEGSTFTVWFNNEPH